MRLTLNRLGEILSLLAVLPGAEAVYRQLLVFVERRFGTDHGEADAVLNILIAQGRYGDAEPILNHAVDMMERMLSADHLLFGVAIGYLGYAYLEQRLIERAQTSLQCTIIVMEARNGDKYLETATEINNLALVAGTRTVGRISRTP